MQPGLVGFKELLREFRGLSIWAVGGSVAVPFAAALAALSPPWPPAIVLITAIAELVALIFVYHFLKKARRKSIDRVLAGSALLLVVFGAIYLVAISLYIFKIPSTDERYVKGYECTADAAAVFKEKCPNLGLDELKTAEYDADRLWTANSIAITRLTVVALWLACFAALSVLVGSFLVFQMREGRARKMPVSAGEGT
jgi:ABC-type xylose transport system permease subunit